MHDDSFKWSRDKGQKLKAAVAEKYNPADFPYLLAVLELADAADPKSIVTKCGQVFGDQKNYRQRDRIRALATLLAGLVAHNTQRLLAEWEGELENRAVDFAFYLARWYKGERSDGPINLALESQELLAAGLGLSRDKFVELFESEAVPPAPAPRLPPQLPKAEQWAAHLLATELMFPKAAFQQSNPKTFYEGSQITAADLKAECDIRRTFYSVSQNSREQRALPYEELFAKSVRPAVAHARAGKGGGNFLFTGPAGTGKTTILERIGFDLHTDRESKIIVLRTTKRTLDYKDVLYDYKCALQNGAKVVALFFDEAGTSAEQVKALIELSTRQRLRLCCFLAEQTNHRELLPKKDVQEFALGKLTDAEIEHLIARLDETGNLGILHDKTPEERLDCFKSRWGAELLVALREATSGKNFDVIIQEEFERIPLPRGQDFYLFTAMAHACGLGLPDAAAKRIARCFKDEDKNTWTQICNSCRKIIQRKPAGELALGAAWRTRHPIIAEVLLNWQYGLGEAVGDADKFADDAAEVLFALDGMSAAQDSRKAVFTLAVNFVRSEEFSHRIAAASDFRRLTAAMNCFDERNNDIHNNFIPATANAWKRDGALGANLCLLREAVRLGKDGCESYPACCEHLAFSLCETKSRDRINEGIEMLRAAWNDWPREISSVLIANGLITLYDFRDEGDDLNTAISIAERSYDHCGDGNKVRAGLTLSRLLTRRATPTDLIRSREIVHGLVTARPKLPAFEHAVARLAEIMAQNTSEELSAAIVLLREALSATDAQPEHEQLLVLFTKLLQQRNIAGDIQEAIDCLEKALATLPTDPAVLMIRLARVLEKSSHENGLKLAIDRMEKALKCFELSSGVNMLRVHFSQLISRRGADGDSERAILELRSAVESPERLANPTLAVLMFGRLLVKHHNEHGVDEAVVLYMTWSESRFSRRHRSALLVKAAELLLKRGAKDDQTLAAGCLAKAHAATISEPFMARIETLQRLVRLPHES